MSRVTRRKHVLKEMLDDDFELPTERQQIVRVVSSCGNNLHMVESAQPDATETFLVSMPTKFRKNMWVKRGDYVLVEPIEEGNKVKAEICKILTREHVKEYTKAGIWPKKFTRKREHEDDNDADMDNIEGDGFVVRNRNRPRVAQELHDDSDSDDEEDNNDGTSSDDD